MDLQNIFLNAPVGLAILSLAEQGESVTISAANTIFAQLLGLSVEEIAGLSLREFVQPVPFDLLLSSLNALLDGECRKGQELSFIARSGEEVCCQIGVSALKATGNRCFMLSAEDITWRKVAEEQRMAEFGIEQREDFIATLTHDLKTPIIGANMVLSALLDGSLGPLHIQQSEIIEKLKSSNQALLKMIHTLLDIYRYDSGPESLLFTRIDFDALLRFCADEMQPLINSKQLHLSIACCQPLEIVCDEQAMQRVITNLLSNAVKFTPEGGSISITAEKSMHVVRLHVQDTGAGMAAKDLDRLFQRFWQGQPGKRYAAGTGLGLYFCNSVIRAHGGNIECKSNTGSGTTFSITLPVLDLLSDSQKVRFS